MRVELQKNFMKGSQILDDTIAKARNNFAGGQSIYLQSKEHSARCLELNWAAFKEFSALLLVGNLLDLGVH